MDQVSQMLVMTKNMIPLLEEENMALLPKKVMVIELGG